jgi:hypothetical protein
MKENQIRSGGLPHPPADTDRRAGANAFLQVNVCLFRGITATPLVFKPVPSLKSPEPYRDARSYAFAPPAGLEIDRREILRYNTGSEASSGHYL